MYSKEFSYSIILIIVRAKVLSIKIKQYVMDFNKILVYIIVEFITPKEQWNAAIFSTAILLGTNIPWVGREKNPLGDTLYLCK